MYTDVAETLSRTRLRAWPTTKLQAIACDNVHRLTIYDTKKRFLQHNTTKLRPRKGRPQKLNEITKRWVYYMVCRRLDISWKALTVKTPGQLSISTIRRALKKYHIRKWRSKKRIPLSKEVAKKRYDFARRWLRDQA
jgi:transposase